MAKKIPEGSNQPIIVKKITIEEHGGHHGGAWKVAYADFVTAMMAFFLLMWLLGATDEKQRKALADYFSPTLLAMQNDSAGSNGLFGGEAINSEDNYQDKASQIGKRSITTPLEAKETEDKKAKDERDRKELKAADVEKMIRERLEKRARDRKLLENIRFTDTQEGVRIDIIDEADFSMFAVATDQLKPRAVELITEVAQVIATVENQLVIRGHTDSLPYASGRNMNNWRLSSARAEATRQELIQHGVVPSRFSRIEGVADTEPYNPEDRFDDRNRRISITVQNG